MSHSKQLQRCWGSDKEATVPYQVSVWDKVEDETLADDSHTATIAQVTQWVQQDWLARARSLIWMCADSGKLLIFYGGWKAKRRWFLGSHMTGWEINARWHALNLIFLWLFVLECFAVFYSLIDTTIKVKVIDGSVGRLLQSREVRRDDFTLRNTKKCSWMPPLLNKSGITGRFKCTCCTLTTST